MVKEAAAKIARYYFEPKSFENNGKIYRRLGLGMKFFKKRGHTPWEKHFKTNFLKHEEKALKMRELSSRILETVHLFGFLGFSYLIYLKFIAEDWEFFALGIVMNAIVNVYPILLQRWVRTRIYRILKKLKS